MRSYPFAILSDGCSVQVVSGREQVSQTMRTEAEHPPGGDALQRACSVVFAATSMSTGVIATRPQHVGARSAASAYVPMYACPLRIWQVSHW
jgi:hypothetical protein